MSVIINTNIRNDIDKYLIDAESVKGGYIVVSGVGSNVKENLPTATIVEGTPVYDAHEKKLYRWSGSAWVEDTIESSYSDQNVISLIKRSDNNIDSAYLGDTYIDENSIYLKDDNSNEYEPVIGNVLENESLGTTDGHVFNDTNNTAYVAGNTNNPKYVTEDKDGNIIIQDIALKSDIHAVELDWGQLGAVK